MEFQDILSRFESVSEQHDGSYVGKCPAHGDSDPSLVIWASGENSKIRLHCRAGCKTPDIVKAAGITMADLFDAKGELPAISAERPKPVGPSMTAPLMMYVGQRAADYAGSRAEGYAHDRFGIMPDDAARLMLGMGYDGNGFKYTGRAFESFPRLIVPFVSFSGVVHGLQGRDLSGNCPGRWVSLTNPEGHEWGKYGIFRGGGHYSATIVTEGPSDALTACAVGYDTVAVRGAALASVPGLVAELAEGLRGTQVIVAGDNDPAGTKFTTRLARGLKEHGVSVYTLTIPQSGWDLTDWRSDNPGAFPAAIHSAVKNAEQWSELKGLDVDEATGALIPSVETAAESLRQIEHYSETQGDSDTLCSSALVAFTGRSIRYVKGIGFFVWNGDAWTQDDDLVYEQAQFMGKSLKMAAENIPNDKTKEARIKLANRFMNAKPLENVLTMLKTLPGVRTKPDDFDSHPHLLSFKNGVVDLRDGSLRDHSPADMLTVTLPINYDPDAQCPRWEQFLTEIMPDHPEMPAYLQRLVGYGITGSVAEQCFGVLWGKGANGKSVFTETLTDVFSGITETTPFSTFEAKTTGGIPNDVAALKGSRLVMASEGESGKPMAEAVLKRVTGKDRITARFMRQEFFTFQPTFLILLATNHKPRFKGQDAGLWRRVKLVPFNRYFAPDERDHTLGDKLLTETAGIVAWAVRGAIEWYANGLQDPDAVHEATKEYQEESDELQGFMPGVVEYTGSDADMIHGADLFQMYLDWCTAENVPKGEEWRKTTFNRAMVERKAVKRRNNKGMAFYGIRKSDPAAREADDAPAGPGIFDPAA